MTTCSDVDAAWVQAVWTDPTITAITPKIFNYEIYETSEREITQYHYNQQINAIQYLITRTILDREIGNELKAFMRFDVEVRYSLEKSTDGASYVAVRDFFDTLTNIVSTELGTSWLNTVDFYKHQPSPPTIQALKIGGIDSWRGVYRFFGETFATI